MSDNKCVCCGSSIPEGSQVCPNCIRKTLGVETVDKEAERKVIRINKFYDIVDNWIAPIAIFLFALFFFLGIAK